MPSAAALRVASVAKAVQAMARGLLAPGARGIGWGVQKMGALKMRGRWQWSSQPGDAIQHQPHTCGGDYAAGQTMTQCSHVLKGC